MTLSKQKLYLEVYNWSNSLRETRKRKNVCTQRLSLGTFYKRETQQEREI